MIYKWGVGSLILTEVPADLVWDPSTTKIQTVPDGRGSWATPYNQKAVTSHSRKNCRTVNKFLLQPVLYCTIVPHVHRTSAVVIILTLNYVTSIHFLRYTLKCCIYEIGDENSMKWASLLKYIKLKETHWAVQHLLHHYSGPVMGDWTNLSPRSI